MSNYHVILSAYGQWLRGDKRGWRERHHRKHVDGDYKNPPEPEFARPIEKYSRGLMKSSSAIFDKNIRKIILEKLREKLVEQNVKVLAISVDRVHVHILGVFPSDEVRQIVGRAKKHTTFLLRQHKYQGAVWAKRSGVHPIKDDSHIYNTWKYIIKHKNKGADVWYVPLEI